MLVKTQLYDCPQGRSRERGLKTYVSQKYTKENEKDRIYIPVRNFQRIDI